MTDNTYSTQVKNFIESEIISLGHKLFKVKKDVQHKTSLSLTIPVIFEGKLEENKEITLEEKDIFLDKLQKLKEVYLSEPFNPEKVAESMINNIINTIKKLEDEYPILLSKLNIAGKNLKTIEDLQKQYKKEFDNYTSLANNYNGSGSTEFYKKMPELKKKMDNLKNEIPKIRVEYNRVKEPEAFTLKRIETLKKELEMYQSKLLNITTTTSTSTSSTTSSSVSENNQIFNPENTLSTKPDVVECWLCEGQCTCE
jgi:hypothetical protein